jgi:lipopolysaccharide transport system ATP-binding protein
LSLPIIQVSHLSKRYIISHEGRESYTAFRDVISKKAKKLFSFPQGLKSKPPVTKEEFWALKDISFDIQQGDRVGIIGRNGAGKSTLLKILSRITEPTGGTVKIKGRVASLLEVGTGFHPELTGRENIFLNGAILGMSRAEIKKHFDAIVDFAEIEKFLDTPVKRYSSGMYVRLAFAVAAHLEPEILVVDEVLAVGDAQFQKKCLGKMEDVSKNEGRTVLFVSHNMAAIQVLTNVGIFLKDGQVQHFGNIDHTIKAYVDTFNAGNNNAAKADLGTGMHTKITRIGLVNGNGEKIFTYAIGDPLIVEAVIATDGTENMSFELFLSDSNTQMKIALMSLYQFESITLPAEPGVYKYTIKLNPINLASGNYHLDAATSIINLGWDHLVVQAVDFAIDFSNPTGTTWDFKSSYGYGNTALLSSDIKTDKIQNINTLDEAGR